MVLFMASTCLLACGCAREENAFLIPRVEENSQNFTLSNCLPLLVTIAWGMPNLQIINLHMKLVVLYSVMVANDSASTHLVK